MRRTFDWGEFLRVHGELLGEGAGEAPATEEQVRGVEERLGVVLPPSYRGFVLRSNGYREASRAVPVLFPVEKIGWFKKLHGDWVMVYEEPAGEEHPMPEAQYFDYSRESSVDFVVGHLRDT